MRATLARSVLTPGGGTSKGRPHEQTAADTHGAPTSRSRRSSSRASRRPSSGATRTFPSTKKSFDEAGFDPCALSLARRPQEGAVHLQAGPCATTTPYGLFASPMSDVKEIHMSSGTTGVATVGGYTQHDPGHLGRVLCARHQSMPTVTRTTSCTCATAYGLFTGWFGVRTTAACGWTPRSSPCRPATPSDQIRVLRGDGALASSAALPATPCTSPTRRSRWESTRPKDFHLRAGHPRRGAVSATTSAATWSASSTTRCSTCTA